MSSFEERVAAERRAAEQIADERERSRELEAEKSRAARRTALAMKENVDDAIAAIVRLPLPPPYKSLWWDQPSQRTGRFSMHMDGPFHQSIAIAEDAKKPLFGNKGTVTPVGWSFHMSAAGFGSGSVGVEVRATGFSSFSVRVPHQGKAEYQLEQFCDHGIIRWEGGTGKDTSWSAGQIRVPDALDLFLTLAAKLVAARGG